MKQRVTDPAPTLSCVQQGKASTNGYQKDTDFGGDPDSDGNVGQYVDSEKTPADTQSEADPAQQPEDEELPSVRSAVRDRLQELLAEREHVYLDDAVLQCKDATEHHDPDDVEEMVYELAVVEDGQVEAITQGGFGVAGSDPDDVPTWERVYKIFNSDHGKGTPYRTEAEKRGYGREAAAQRLIHDENYIVYIAEDVGDEDIYLYNPENGRYEKDEGALKNIIHGKLGAFANKNTVNQIKEKLEAFGRCGYHEVNARHKDGMYVNTNNCVLRIDDEGADGPWDWEVLEHDPSYRFIGYSVDVDWPFVDGEDVDVDLEWTLDWMRSMFNDDHSFKVLAELFGASLRDDQRFKAFGAFGGPTNGGKSKAAEAWLNVTTLTNMQGIALHDLAEDQFASHDFFLDGGAMINIGTDIPDKKIDDSSPLKTYTTNDVTSHQVKHETRFNGIVPCFNLQIFNNHPVMDPDGGAVPTRMKYLYFPYRFESTYSDVYDPDAEYIKKADPDLEERLGSQPVKNALFVLAMEGLYRLYQFEGTFSFELGEDERWELYQSRADTVQSFMMDCVENSDATDESGMEVYLTRDELHEMYKSWEQTHGKESKSRSNFTSLVQDVHSHHISYKRTRKTDTDSEDKDREWVFWRLAPSGEGWDHVDGGAKARTIEEFGVTPDQDPDPSDDEEGAESSPDVSDVIVSALTTHFRSDGVTASYGAILEKVTSRSDVDADRTDVDAALFRLQRGGEIEETEDGFKVVSSDE